MLSGPRYTEYNAVPTETLHFENPRVAQQLYNSDPRNLQAVEQQLGVKATSRDEWIKLEGEPEEEPEHAASARAAAPTTATER